MENRLSRSNNSCHSTLRSVRNTLIFALLYPFTLVAEESDSYPLGAVILELKWKHAFQFAGYYAAVEKGFYREAGINVTLAQHLTAKSPTDVLLEGGADYATTGMEVVIHRANNEPVVALAAIFQHSPMAFLVTDASGIERAEEFRGRRLMIQKTYQDIALMATLRKVGISENDYQHIPTTFDALSLVRDEADVFGGYITDQGFYLAEMGTPNHYILPRHYGIDFYGDVLVTSEKEIANHPKRVSEFLKASLKGWEYALRHQEEIIELILEKYNTQNKSREHLQFEARESRDLIQPILVGIGHMNPARWEHVRKVFVELGLLDTQSDISGLMYQDQNSNKGNWFTKNWLILTISMALFTFVSLLAFAFQLRRLVTKRTQELINSESELRALINIQPAIIMTADRQGKILSINKTGLTMINAKSSEEVYRTPLENFVDGNLSTYQETMDKVFSGNLVNIVIKARKMDGTLIWLDLHAVHFANPSLQISRILIVCYDITDKLKIKGDKARLQTELQVARKMEALGHLTGGIAHDFNNLLAIILGYANIAQQDSDGDDRAELLQYFESISHAGERAKNLVDQMLTFSRGDTGESTSVELGALIKSDLKILTAALPSSIIFDIQIESNLPSVHLTHTQFSQILMNITINARDAMSGQGTLSIKLARTMITDNSCSACHKIISGNWVELSISDTGTGINPTIIERMFEPFFTTKAVGKGSGMGLSVIYGIVHNKQGHIIVNSKEGVGTTFRILFPADDNKEIVVAEETDILIKPQGKGVEILVIDDEIDYGDFMKKLLDQNGYQTFTTNDPLSALQLFKSDPERFKIIITDQTMPAMTGVELINNIRAIRPNIPIILCTGYSEHFSKEDAEKIKVSYLSKPARIETLLSKMDKLLKM